MILNFLDQLLDDILNDSFFFMQGQKIKISKNQDILSLIDEIQKVVRIKDMINKLLIDNKITIQNVNYLHKLHVIYYRYMFSYMLIYLGVTKYAKTEQEFMNLLIFSYNNYLEDYLNPKTNNVILMLRKVYLQLMFIMSLKKEKLKTLPEKEFFISIKFLEKLGEPLKEMLKEESKETLHNLIKILMIKEMYIDNEKWILTEIFETEILSADYKYIDVYLGDFNQVDLGSLKNHYYKDKYRGLPEQFIELIREVNKEADIVSLTDKLDFLINHGYIIPITNDFYRFHVPNDSRQFDDIEDGMQKENLKIKNIIKKTTASRDRLLAEKNLLFINQYKDKLAISFNLYDELRLVSKVVDEYNRIKPSVQNKNLYDELQSFQLTHYFDFESNNLIYTASKPIRSFRLCDFDNKKNKIEFRNIKKDEEIHIHGFVVSNKLREISFGSKVYRGRDFSHLSLSEFSEKFVKFFSKEPCTAYVIFGKPSDIDIVDEIYDIVQKFLYEDSLQEQNYSKYYDKLVDSYKIKLELNQFLSQQFQMPSDFIEYKIDLSNLQPLSIIKYKTPKYSSLKLNIVEQVEDEKEILSSGTIRCNHFLTLEHILHNPEDFTQNLFEFSKKYAMLNDDELLVCKSCGTYLEVYKYISSGAVDEYSGEYIITSVIDNVSLFDKKEYQIYFKIIKQLDKLIDDKISKIMNLIYISGNESSNARKRENLLKDIIDLLLQHNAYLLDYILVSNKFRGEKKESIYDRKNYGIEDSLSFLFSFKLDNNILLKSSDDTDKYKIIKYHNILIYIILVLLLDLTESNIISLVSNHKLCNISLYEKNQSFFTKARIIQDSSGDTVELTKFPVLCYLLTIFACMFNEYGLYQDPKGNKILSIKMIIVSLIDLLNTILLINATQIQGKNYLYQVISNRFFQKAYTLFNSESLLKRVKDIQLGVKEKSYQSIKTISKSSVIKLGQTLERNFSFKRTLQSVNSKIKHLPNHIKMRNVNRDIVADKNILDNKKATKPLPEVKLNKLRINTNIQLPQRLKSITPKDLLNILEKFHKNANLNVDHAIIKTNHQGIKLEKPLKTAWSELKIIPYESFFKQPVIYYTDVVNKEIKVYYNAKYLNLLGYKEKSGKYSTFVGSNIYIEKEINITEQLTLIGFTKERYNILQDVAVYIQRQLPHLPEQDVENHLYKLRKIDEISDKLVNEAKKTAVLRICEERINNLKTIINRTKTALYQLIDGYFVNVIPNEVMTRNPTLEDEYNPNLPVKELVEKSVLKSRGNFSFKANNLFVNSEFLNFNLVDASIPIPDEYIIERETLSNINFMTDIVNYLCEQIYAFLEQNQSSNENIKYFLFNFILELIQNEYNFFYRGDHNSQTFFEKQLFSTNYKSAFDKKLNEQEVQVEVKEVEDTAEPQEPDSSLDDDLSEMINDIDQEEGNFDIEDDA